MGQCPGCREWNTFVEEPSAPKTVGKASVTQRHKSEPVTLSQIDLQEDTSISSGIEELDRVLGGGIVQGSLVLVGGDPGIGKSTLLLQMCRHLSERKIKVLYISGEESLKPGESGLFPILCCFCARQI